MSNPNPALGADSPPSASTPAMQNQATFRAACIARGLSPDQRLFLLWQDARSVSVGADKATDELLPCPFCDSPAKLFSVGEHSAAAVNCTACDAYGPSVVGKLAATAAWNRRAALAAGAPDESIDVLMLKRQIHNLKRHIEDYCQAAGAPVQQSQPTDVVMKELSHLEDLAGSGGITAAQLFTQMRWLVTSRATHLPAAPAPTALNVNWIPRSTDIADPSTTVYMPLDGGPATLTEPAGAAPTDDPIGEFQAEARQDKLDEMVRGWSASTQLAGELPPGLQGGCNYIMEAVQCFASEWSLVGGHLDNGGMLEQAEATKKRIRNMLEDDARKLAVALAARQAPAEAAKELDWRECERISDLPAVDDALHGFSEDPTGDNATCVVRAILAARQVVAPDAGLATASTHVDAMSVLDADRHARLERRLAARRSGGERREPAA